jgi:hypothetical protein
MVSHPVEHRDERGARRQATKAVTAPTRFLKEAILWIILNIDRISTMAKA